MAGFLVNGVTISREQIRAEAARLRREIEESGGEVTPEMSMALREEAEQTLIDRVLLTQEAERLSLQATTEEIESHLASMTLSAGGVAGCRAEANTRELRAEVARRAAIDKLFDRWTQQAAPSTRRQVRAVYKSRRDEFWTPETVFVRQIVRNVQHPDERDSARAVLDGALDALAAGADFGELAKTWSDCPEDGGALGYISRGRMVPEFDDVVFALELNRHSPVFETRFGFHIALVNERRPAGPVSLSDATPAIEDGLRRAAMETEFGKWLDALRAAASIERVRA